MPAPVALNDGVIAGQAINPAGVYNLLGQNNDARIWCGGMSDLTIQVEMTGGVATDLTVVVSPYEADGATVIPVPLVPSSQPTTNPSFAAAKVYYTAVYDVSGYDMVRVQLTNNNAGAQNIVRASWRLAAGG